MWRRGLSIGVGLTLCGTASADDMGLGSKVDRLELHSVSGSVRVLDADDGVDEIVLVTSGRIDNTQCDLQIDKRKGTATVRFGPKSQEQPEQCSLDIRVLLPSAHTAAVELLAGPVILEPVSAALEVTVHAGDLTIGATTDAITASVLAGDVRVDGATGPLTVDVRSGEMRGTLTGPLDVTLGTGLVVVGGLTRPVTAKSGVGHLQLTWTEAPATGTIRAEASSGNVVIDLPGMPTVHCLVGSTLGAAQCDLPSSDDAPLTVHALTGNGSVRVF